MCYVALYIRLMLVDVLLYCCSALCYVINKHLSCMLGSICCAMCVVCTSINILFACLRILTAKAANVSGSPDRCAYTVYTCACLHLFV
jgi:hypothetical protein